MVWRKLTRESLEKTKREFASSGYVMQWYAMAMEVILCTLGPVWWRENCTTTAMKPDEFLAVPIDCDEHRYNHQDRIIRLGHMLYALAECEGYETFISSLKTRDLAPAYFELLVANLLHQSTYTVQFVEPEGSKGEDYDLFVERDENWISVEAKSRRTGIILEERKLHSTLGKARRQLPSSGPGIIFVSIPQEWTMDRDSQGLIGDCVDAFLRNTSRVNYVALIWHQWIELEVGRGSASMVCQYENPNPRKSIDLGQVVRPMKMPISLKPERQDFTPSFW